MAMAARMAMIATTIINSIKVKPRCCVAMDIPLFLTRDWRLLRNVTAGSVPSPERKCGADHTPVLAKWRALAADPRRGANDEQDSAGHRRRRLHRRQLRIDGGGRRLARGQSG